jgi:DNA polymerase eta
VRLTIPAKTTETIEDASEDAGWKCPRCRETFAAPEEMALEAKQIFVQAQKQEHEDFHYALDLQDGDRPSGPTARPTLVPNGAGKGKVKKKKSEGIKAFFTPKPSK